MRLESVYVTNHDLSSSTDMFIVLRLICKENSVRIVIAKVDLKVNHIAVLIEAEQLTVCVLSAPSAARQQSCEHGLRGPPPRGAH